MDPITTAIVAALPALSADVVSSALKGAYAGLKSLIARKFGAASAVARSIDDLEANPESKGRAIVLSEHVEAAKAASDAEILAAVRRLVEALSKDQAAATSNVHIESTVSGGEVGVAGAQNVSVGALNVGAFSSKDKK